MGQNTRLLDRLYIGPAPEDSQGFSHIVLCAEEYQPPSEKFGDSQVLRVPLDDAKLTSTEALAAESAARLIEKAWREGGNILITCQMGRNRSALVCAIAIARIKSVTRRRAAEYVRAKRRDALGVRALQNPTFWRYLTEE